MTTLIYADTLPGGKHWSMMLRRNSRLKLTDVEGGANVGMLFYNPLNLLERYNAPDTLKCQHTFKLTQGTASTPTWAASSARSSTTRGWHDTVCGNTTKAIGRGAMGRERAIRRIATTGSRTATTASWSRPPSTASAGAISPPTSTGSARSWRPTTARCRSTRARRKAGASVELRFEMDTLVLFHTCPHPLNPSADYPRKPVRYEICEGPPAAADDRLPPVGAGERPRLREQPPLPRRLLRGRRTMIKESPLDPDAAHYRKVVPAGDYWMHVVRKGETLRIVDLEGNQAADTLFFNADDPAERYSACDTIREQGNVYLSAGTVLMSDLCRPMLTITADTVGRHDTLGGACATESNTVRYALEKKIMHACRDSFLLAVAENEHYGLTKRDIAPQHQFLHERAGDAGRRADVRRRRLGAGQVCRDAREMNVIVLISNCPQLNNPATPTTRRPSRC